jgi:hypothetical protein
VKVQKLLTVTAVVLERMEYIPPREFRADHPGEQKQTSSFVTSTVAGAAVVALYFKVWPLMLFCCTWDCCTLSWNSLICAKLFYAVDEVIV